MMKNRRVEGMHINQKPGLTLGPVLLMADQVGQKAWVAWANKKLIWEEGLKQMDISRPKRFEDRITE